MGDEGHTTPVAPPQPQEVAVDLVTQLQNELFQLSEQLAVCTGVIQQDEPYQTEQSIPNQKNMELWAKNIIQLSHSIYQDIERLPPTRPEQEELDLLVTLDQEIDNCSQELVRQCLSAEEGLSRVEDVIRTITENLVTEKPIKIKK